MWVEGEISNFAAPHSGHWYFSFKRFSRSSSPAAMFRPQNSPPWISAERWHAGFSEKRASAYMKGVVIFKLLIEHMEEAGVGKLRQEFGSRSKKRLHDAGLFDEAHKKALPTISKNNWVSITSPTGRLSFAIY